MARRTKKSSRRNRRHKGAGYADGPEFIKGAPGYIVHHSYSGPQTDFSPLTDCTGNPMSHRPGWIPAGTDNSIRGGLPGWRGGKQRRKRGGASYPPMASLGDYANTPAYGVITPPPKDMPNPSGSGGSVGNPNPYPPHVVAVPPGGVVPAGAKMPPGESSHVVAAGQKGGRYGFFPGMGPLNSSNGVGTSPAPFGRIACEVGAPNPLNPDPKGVQTMDTAPLTPKWITGPPHAYSSLMRGGGNDNMGGAPAGVGSNFSAANFPTIQVGQADMMKYEAPTAGYSHAFQTFKAPSPVPALMLNTPYDARTFNPACIQTGAGRKRRGNKTYKKRRSGGGVATDAGSFTPLTNLSEVGSRYDFDFTRKGLPVKFGGSRKKGWNKKNRKSYRKRK
jgi:hypothetical protein